MNASGKKGLGKKHLRYKMVSKKTPVKKSLHQKTKALQTVHDAPSIKRTDPASASSTSLRSSSSLPSFDFPSRDQFSALCATPYASYALGSLPHGCRLCVEGKKTVFFVTGICPRKCFYCPLAPEKNQHDVLYANEVPLLTTTQLSSAEQDLEKVFAALAEEIRLCGSAGIGITGGDPLARPQRVAYLIKRLKEEFGSSFHIHLYTSFVLATEKNLSLLAAAGLDELRFHPDFFNPNEWQAIHLARRYSWSLGIEIPLIAQLQQQTIAMIDFFLDHVDFINLNELELSWSNEEAMQALGIRLKENSPSAAEQSLDFGLWLLHYYATKLQFPLPAMQKPRSTTFNTSFHAPALQRKSNAQEGGVQHLQGYAHEESKSNKLGKSLPSIHLCTAALKDGHQLRKRMQLRAERIAKPYDTITDEGLLMRGVVYLKTLAPGLQYKEKLAAIKSISQRYAFHQQKLVSIAEQLQAYFGKDNVGIDANKFRLLIPLSALEELKKARASRSHPLHSLLKELVFGWVEEYPTYDQFEIELELL
ncbi:MAG: radical SAM protein [Candidatus Woesearchaeota archaeon]